MLRSFINISTYSHFPIQNLPYGVFKLRSGSDACVGVAIGDYVLDLSVLEEKGLFKKTNLGDKIVFNKPSLNERSEERRVGKRVYVLV